VATQQATNGLSVSRAEGLSSAPMPSGVNRLVKDSPKEGFPFSPPLPSPLSPKLLMGLADSDAALETLDDAVNSLEQSLQSMRLNSDPTPIPAKVEPSNAGGGGAVPPAACSPAPFSRMEINRGRRGAKRRSCAITCKVSAGDQVLVLWEGPAARTQC